MLKTRSGLVALLALGLALACAHSVRAHQRDGDWTPRLSNEQQLAWLAKLTWPEVDFSRTTGDATVDWSKLMAQLPEALRANGVPTTVSTVRMVVDAQRTFTAPVTDSKAKIHMGFDGQIDLMVEFLDANGTVLHACGPILFESLNSQTIAKGSFGHLPVTQVELPKAFVARTGIDTELTDLAVRLSRDKLVWTFKSSAPASDREVYAIDAVVTPTFGSDKRVPTAFEFADPRTGARRVAPASDFHLKVDAAFNGNAFFWDDMFVSLATSWHHPELARGTADFWYDVQKAHQSGVIPREVRKKNLLSYNPSHTYLLGVKRAHGDYTNPYLADWMEWQLFTLTGDASRLPRALQSMRDYARWFESERAVRDASGAAVPGGFWTSNLGSGKDNAPRGGGNANYLAFDRTAWIDMLSQQVELYKSMARMQMAMGDFAAADVARAKAADLDAIMNREFWSAAEGFYFDRTPSLDHRSGPLMLDVSNSTIAGFWPLWSLSATPAQADAIAEKQLTATRYGGDMPLASIPSEHPWYTDDGNYWKGGRWPNMLAVAAEGFEKSGRPDVALDLSTRFLRGMAQAAQDYVAVLGRKTIFEFYGVTKQADGSLRARRGKFGDHNTRIDFTGWGKIPPVQTMLRNVIGLRPVPAYAGPAEGRERWMAALRGEGDELSSLMRGSNYLSANPAAMSADQQSLEARGYLEWNLHFDSGSEPIVVRNITIQGVDVDELRLVKGNDHSFHLTAKSRAPIRVQVNRLYRPRNGASLASPLGETARAPLAGSQILEVGGAHAEAAFDLVDAAH